MVEIPIILRLKKKQYKDIAKAQDLIVRELLKLFEKAVLHGGTAIWRCYNGNRFSEDIDVYIEKNIEKINILLKNLESKGFVIEKKKISENSFFISLKIDNTVVRLEGLFRKQKGVLKEYETAEGNLATIYTLTPEEIIKEKIEAYLKRLKVRDIYDIFFLLRYVNDKGIIKTELNRLISNFRMPFDEKELKILIIEGLAPNAKEILQYIKRSV